MLPCYGIIFYNIAWIFDGVQDIIRLPGEARVDHDHEALLQDIIRLPGEASQDTCISGKRRIG